MSTTSLLLYRYSCYYSFSELTQHTKVPQDHENQNFVPLTTVNENHAFYMRKGKYNKVYIILLFQSFDQM